jgi:hypothetical protein
VEWWNWIALMRFVRGREVTDEITTLVNGGEEG